MTRLTVELPDDLAESITLMAANRGFGTPQMAVVLMRASVSQREAKRERQALKSLSNEDVLPLAELQLTPQQDARLHALLDLNGEGEIDANQRRELDALMEIYDDALLRKAMGWAEAVRRKLRPPMSAATHSAGAGKAKSAKKNCDRVLQAVTLRLVWTVAAYWCEAGASG